MCEMSLMGGGYEMILMGAQVEVALEIASDQTVPDKGGGWEVC